MNAAIIFSVVGLIAVMVFTFILKKENEFSVAAFVIAALCLILSFLAPYKLDNKTLTVGKIIRENNCSLIYIKEADDFLINRDIRVFNAKDENIIAKRVTGYNILGVSMNNDIIVSVKPKE